MESKWEEAVVTKFKILFGHWPGRAGEKHEILQDNSCPRRESNHVSPKHMHWSLSLFALKGKVIPITGRGGP
jgi:hypothetical protein